MLSALAIALIAGLVGWLSKSYGVPAYKKARQKWLEKRHVRKFNSSEDEKKALCQQLSEDTVTIANAQFNREKRVVRARELGISINEIMKHSGLSRQRVNSILTAKKPDTLSSQG